MESVEMQDMQEFIPFAKEILNQGLGWGVLKVYLVGSVFAVLGTVIGMVETIFHLFSSDERMDAETALMLAREQRNIKDERWNNRGGQEVKGKEELTHKYEVMTQSKSISKIQRLSNRTPANRLHAS